jgi:hypothetical protein
MNLSAPCIPSGFFELVGLRRAFSFPELSYRMIRKRNTIGNKRDHLLAGRSSRNRARFGERPQDSHNARRNYERYVALAQAELQAGDRVAAENYYQHAEHYLRMSSDRAAT